MNPFGLVLFWWVMLEIKGWAWMAGVKMVSVGYLLDCAIFAWSKCYTSESIEVYFTSFAFFLAWCVSFSSNCNVI